MRTRLSLRRTLSAAQFQRLSLHDAGGVAAVTDNKTL